MKQKLKKIAKQTKKTVLKLPKKFKNFKLTQNLSQEDKQFKKLEDDFEKLEEQENKLEEQEKHPSKKHPSKKHRRRKYHRRKHPSKKYRRRKHPSKTKKMLNALKKEEDIIKQEQRIISKKEDILEKEIVETHDLLEQEIVETHDLLEQDMNKLKENESTQNKILDNIKNLLELQLKEKKEEKVRDRQQKIKENQMKILYEIKNLTNKGENEETNDIKDYLKVILKELETKSDLKKIEPSFS